MPPSLLQLDELRVPVRRARVQLHTVCGSRSVVIFLAPTSSPEEILEDDATFFPAEEGGVVRLYARAAVVRLVVEDGGAPPDATACGVTYQTRSIAVHLAGEAVVRGTLMTLSAGARTLDLVNQTGKTFAVYADGKVHHIAKAHVEHIEETP